MLAQKTITARPVSLGRYQITGVLGEGAMGMVYKAFDPAIERTVAVKTINMRFVGRDAQPFTDRFYREAKAAGQLNHPNIVTIYDIAEADGIAYIAMELLEGLSLKQIIDTGKRPSVARAARIIAEVADALGYAHDHGIIHRDVKPANIVLTRSGLVKITDFGIAQLPATACTQPGLLIGSPCYMSPEQVEGTWIDGRCDIFSLGTVLYELLTGRTPFFGKDLSDLMYRILHEVPVPPSQIAPNTGKGLDAVIEYALAKNADDRFQSARDFARTLRAYQAYPNAPRPSDERARKTVEANKFSGSSGTHNADIRLPDSIAPYTKKVKKSSAWTPIGVIAGSILASLSLNQFSPPPNEHSSPQTHMANKPLLGPMDALVFTPLQIARNEKPATLTVIPQPGASKTPKPPPPDPDLIRLNELNQQLKQLQTELADLKTRFTDLHPDVVAKRRHIEELEKQKEKYQHI